MTVSADLFLKDCPSLFPELKPDFGQYSTVLHIMETGLAPYGARLRKPETGLAFLLPDVRRQICSFFPLFRRYRRVFLFFTETDDEKSV